MAPVTIGFGILLGLLGLGFFIGTEAPTALIPAYAGVVFVLLGLVGLIDRFRKHAMHAASALGLLGFLGPGSMGFPKLVLHMTGGEVARPAAAVEQSIMAALCAVFVGLCVRSFIQARRARASSDSSIGENP